MNSQVIALPTTSNKILQWFRTPLGSDPGRPGFGHELAGLRELPPSVDTEIFVEMEVIKGLHEQIPGLSISGIRVSIDDAGRCVVKLQHNDGYFEHVFDLLNK